MAPSFHSTFSGTILVLVLSRTSYGSHQSVNIDTEYSDGVLLEKMSPPPIFYETYIPLIFTYELPTYTESTLKLYEYPPIKGSSFCSSSSFNKSCPNTYYTDQLIRDELIQNLTKWEYTKQIVMPSPPEFSTHNNEFCTDIRQHFLLIATSSLNAYLKKLMNCPLKGDFMISKTVPHFSSQKFFNTMSSNVSPNYYAHLSSYINFIATLNFQSAIHSIYLLQKFMESTKWATAAEICRMGKIPPSLLNPVELKFILTELDSKLSTKNFDLSIPVRSAGMYYSLPLADCVFTTASSTLVLRVLVPIRSKRTIFESFSTRSVPFIQGNITTERNTCFVKNVDSKSFVVNKNTKTIIEKKCEPDQLCHIRKSQEENFVSTLKDSCVSAVYNNLSQEIIEKRCPLECWPIDDIHDLSSEPYFRYIGSDSLTISGGGHNTTIFVMCDSPTEVIKPAYYGEGALKIWVPCDCQIFYNQFAVFQSQNPCSTFRIRRLLPYGWNSIQIKSSEDTTTEISPIAVTWKSTTVVNIKESKIIGGKEHDFRTDEGIIISSSNHLLITFLNLALTLITLCLLLAFAYKMYRLNHLNKSYKHEVDRLISMNVYDLIEK